MKPLSIVVWLWGNKYTEQHVNVLSRAVKNNLSIPFTFYCITDRTNKSLFDKDVMIVPLWENLKELQLQYRRLYLHSEDMREYFGERILQLDLEMIVLEDFTHLVDSDLPFKIWKCPSTCSRGWMYNTSMMLMDTGYYSKVWDRYRHTPGKQIALKNSSKWLGSDQAILSLYLPANCPVWTKADGVYSYKMEIEPHTSYAILPPSDAVIVAPYTKNYDPAKLLHNPWVKAYWEGYCQNDLDLVRKIRI